MSRPWMPFYIGDYLTDTMHLTTLEHGAYLLLIMNYWRNGGLPSDDKKLAAVVRLRLSAWLKIKPTIQAFFSDDWRHKRIDFETARVAEKTILASKSASKGWHKRHINQQNMHANALQTPCELDTSMHSKRNANAMLSQSQSESELEIITKIPRSRARNELFDEFYSAYPKRLNRKAALSRWETTLKGGVDPQRIISAAQRYARACSSACVEKQFIKAPDVWLNKGCYDDEDLPGRPNANGQDKAYVPVETKSPWRIGADGKWTKEAP